MSPEWTTWAAGVGDSGVQDESPMLTAPAESPKGNDSVTVSPTLTPASHTQTSEKARTTRSRPQQTNSPTHQTEKRDTGDRKRPGVGHRNSGTTTGRGSSPPPPPATTAKSGPEKTDLLCRACRGLLLASAADVSAEHSRGRLLTESVPEEGPIASGTSRATSTAETAAAATGEPVAYRK